MSDRMAFNDLRVCDLCHEPVSGKTRAGAMAIDFHRIVVERFLLDRNAIQERAGLAMMFGGSEALADVMGARSGEAAHAFDRRELLVCNPCWYEPGLRDLQGLGERKVGRDLGTPETAKRFGGE